MINRFIILGAAWTSLLAGCATDPVVLAPVGPNPVGLESKATTGQLEVFSSLVEQCDDQNQAGDGSPVWYQHSDYRIYSLHGKLVRYVGNSVGHYSQTPRLVSLPPGRYHVKALANNYLRVDVPVVIKPGRTTRVHLDNAWKLPGNTPEVALISIPGGYAVGWRSEMPEESGVP